MQIYGKIFKHANNLAKILLIKGNSLFILKIKTTI